MLLPTKGKQSGSRLPHMAPSESAVLFQRNGMKLIQSSPYHPYTNGLAEQFVSTLKAAIRRNWRPTSMADELFLLSYYTTPHSTTNFSPHEIPMQRSLQTPFELLTLELEETLCQKQAEQKKDHDLHILGHMNSSLDNESWYVIWGMVHIGCREES